MFDFLKNLRTQTQQQPDWQAQKTEQPKYITPEEQKLQAQLKILKDKKQECINKINKLIQDRDQCIKEKIATYEASYPVKKLYEYQCRIRAYFDQDNYDLCKEIVDRYQAELQEAEKEYKKAYKEFHALDPTDPDDEKVWEEKYKADTEACNKVRGIQNLIDKKQREIKKELKARYPYEMLSVVQRTLMANFEVVKEQVTDQYLKDYQPHIDKLEIEAATIDAEIEQLLNPIQVIDVEQQQDDSTIENDSQQPT